MRRRWPLTSSNVAKKDFNETVFPLKDAGNALDSSITYKVSTSSVMEIPATMPEGLRQALETAGNKLLAAKYPDLLSLIASVPSHNFGIIVPYQTVWWLEHTKLNFWCWKSNVTFTRQLKHEVCAVAVSEPRFTRELLALVPELSYLIQLFNRLDARTDIREALPPFEDAGNLRETAAPPSPDDSPLSENLPGPSNYHSSATNHSSAAKGHIYQRLVVVTKRHIEEAILVGTESDGVLGYEEVPFSKVRFDGSRLTSIFSHGPAGRTFLGDDAGIIYEYESFSLRELYVTVEPTSQDSYIRKPSAWAGVKLLESLQESASKVSNYVSGFLNIQKFQNKVSTQGQLRRVGQLLDLRGQIMKCVNKAKTPIVRQFSPGRDDVLYVLTSTFSIYAIVIPPPYIHLVADSILKFHQPPTNFQDQPILSWDSFSRSLLDWLEVPVPPSKPPFDERAGQPDHDLRQKILIVQIHTTSTGGLELLLSDGTRVICSTSQRRWNGRSEDTGKGLHDALRLRLDNYVWTLLQLNPQTLPPAAEHQPLVIVHVRWPPQQIAASSTLFQAVQRKTAADRGDMKRPPPPEVGTSCVVAAIAAGARGLLTSGVTTSSEISNDVSLSWLLYQCPTNGHPGALAFVNGRCWEQVTTGDCLLACAASDVMPAYHRLMTSDRDYIIWDICKRIEIAAIICQLPKHKNLQTLVSSSAASFGIDGMPQLSILKAMTYGGFVGITMHRLFVARQKSLAETLEMYLTPLKNLIDAIFKDLNFSIPFAPYGGIHIQDPYQLVAALERCATVSLPGLTAWSQFAVQTSFNPLTQDVTSNLAKSVTPAEAARLIYATETRNTINMCWHFLATAAPPPANAANRDTVYSDNDRHATREMVDTCCRLLFCLTSLAKLRDGYSLGANISGGESESLSSLKRFVLQLLTDFSRRPIFEVSSSGILVAKTTVDTQTDNVKTSPSFKSRKRTRSDRDKPHSGQGEIAFTTRLTPEDYRRGRECCRSLNQALRIYDNFIKSQVSLDVRNKVQEDISHFNEITDVLKQIEQFFNLIILISEGVRGHHRLHVDAEILLPLAQLSFASLFGHVVMEKENNLLQKWFKEGSLTRFISPSAMAKECDELFDQSSLQWSAAIEPMECLADSFDAAHVDRRRQHTEKLNSNTPSNVLPFTSTGEPLSQIQTDVGALEYLFSLWEQECDLVDLNICLPLPSFARSRLSNEVFDLTFGDGIRAEARSHALNALKTYVLVGRDKGEAYKDAMIKQFLDILFRVHAYDFFHLSLAIWADISTRYNLWSRGKEVSMKNPNELPLNITQTINDYLSRLATIAIKTDRILGWDLLTALIRELACSEVPVFRTDLALDTFSSSLQPYEQQIAHVVFQWMIDNENSPLPLKALMESLQSPHINSWLEIQNQRNDVTAAHKLSTAVSEVYLSQKNYSQALTHLLSNLEAQPNWLELPVKVSMIKTTRLPLESNSQSKGPQPTISIRILGATLSCVRGIIDPVLVPEMRQAFREKLMGGIDMSEDWKHATHLVSLIRRAGGYPIDQRVDVLLKCLVLSIITDHAGSSAPAIVSQTEEPSRKYESTSLLSSRLRGVMSQNQPNNFVMDQFTKAGQVLQQPEMRQLTQRQCGSTALTSRRADSIQRPRRSETRRLSPRSSQLIPSQTSSSIINSNLLTAAPLASHSTLVPSSVNHNNVSTASSKLMILTDEEAERLKVLSSSQGLVLDKMAESLPLPGYVSKHGSGVGLRRSETDRLRHIQSKLICQWSILVDMVEYLIYLMIDNSMKKRIMELLHELDSEKSNVPEVSTAFEWQSDARDELLRNTVGMIAKLLHSYFATPYALVDYMLKFAVANVKVAPLNLISVLECWAQLDERRLRINEEFKLLPESLRSIGGDTAMCMVVVNSTVAERLVLARRHNNFSIFSDMFLRFWNVFSNSLVDTGERQMERRILLEGNASSPLRVLPGILWRIASSRLLESCHQGDGKLMLGDGDADVKLLCERKTRLNKFMDVWNDGLSGEFVSHVFVYEACVRAFMWDLVGLTRDPTTAASCDSQESMTRLSMANPQRVINVLRPATHWLYAIAMNIKAELETTGSASDISDIVGAADFLSATRSTIIFSGKSMDRLLLDHIYVNVIEDLTNLITWIAYCALPGLSEFYSTLAVEKYSADLRYLVPILIQRINEFQTPTSRQTKARVIENYDLESLYGGQCYEHGLYDVLDMWTPDGTNIRQQPRWLIDVQAMLPPLPTHSAGVTELLDALLDSLAALNVIASTANESTVVPTAATIAALGTVLKNYKLCVQNGTYPSKGAF